MNKIFSVKEINDALKDLDQVWVYICEYRLSHGYLHIMLTDGNFGKLADIYFHSCGYIHGPTIGGPWNFFVEEESIGTNKEIMFANMNKEFIIRAINIYFTPSPPGSRYSAF